MCVYIYIIFLLIIINQQISIKSEKIVLDVRNW